MAKGKVCYCDSCGHPMLAKPKFHKDGEMEYLYLRCPKCRAVSMISASDEELRSDIERYQRMVDVPAGERLSLAQYREAESLHKANIERSRELKTLRPLVF